MKNLIYILAVISALVALPAAANAACYADYKAKKGSPLKLSYGVIELPQAACSDFALAGEITQKRIRVGGWTLLQVISLFGPEGLEQRKKNAGKYYLRF